MKRRRYLMLVLIAGAALSGCATLCDRRDFAHKAARGAGPVLQEYRGYVAKDSALNDNEKRMRQMLADELEGLLKDGGK